METTGFIEWKYQNFLQEKEMIWKEKEDVLKSLAGIPEDSTQTKLAEEIGMRQPALSKMFKRNVTKIEAFLLKALSMGR